MSKPKRIQRKRTKGWRMPEGAVYVGRPTKWGNPYTLAGARETGYDGTDAALRDLCKVMFERWLRDPESEWSFGAPAARRIEAEIGVLRGKDLACWCPLDEPCHADVLLELANR